MATELAVHWCRRLAPSARGKLDAAATRRSSRQARGLGAEAGGGYIVLEGACRSPGAGNSGQVLKGEPK